MRWTAEDLPDLTGSTALVTGANNGLGLFTALELARHGADVILAGRNLDRGTAALARTAPRCPTRTCTGSRAGHPPGWPRCGSPPTRSPRALAGSTCW